MKKLIVLLVMIFILIFTGCSKLEPMPFGEIYSGELSKLSKIEIRHGNGELKAITDKSIINPWLESIKDIVIEPSVNQETKVGYIYNVKLFEGEELKLSFSTTKINDFYYKENEQIMDKIHSLFNEN